MTPWRWEGLLSLARSIVLRQGVKCTLVVEHCSRRAYHGVHSAKGYYKDRLIVVKHLGDFLEQIGAGEKTYER